MEQVEKVRDRNYQLKLALLSLEGIMPEKVFPEELGGWGKVDDDNADVSDSHDQSGEPISTAYDYSNAEFDPKKAEEEIREIMARFAQGEASFEAPVYSDWQ